jgi:hypothetical protein
MDYSMKPNLEKDLLKSDLIEQKVKDDNYANDLYAALCNNEFTKNDELWSCSWRYAGGIVAQLRWSNEDYLSYYCAGNEGNITEEVRKDLESLGWKPIQENQ